MKTLSKQEVLNFQQKIYDYYKQHRRSFAWREGISPYRIVVSEIMLQQTQTSRVIHKFSEWIRNFPNFDILAKSSKQQVLSCWQGLGYNRRGLALHEFAKKIIHEYKGMVPADQETLQTFKGIGPNTAGSICAFAYNKPVVFIETNIRTVFMYEFFKHEEKVHDKDLLPLIKQAVDHKNAREWYYALMDYGVHLKTKLKVSNKKSKHYIKQSQFEGSKRQMRGAVVRVLSKMHTLSYDELSELVTLDIPGNKHDLLSVVEDLQKDGVLKYAKDIISF